MFFKKNIIIYRIAKNNEDCTSNCRWCPVKFLKSKNIKVNCENQQHVKKTFKNYQIWFKSDLFIKKIKSRRFNG
jgi:hypothetical protein